MPTSSEATIQYRPQTATVASTPFQKRLDKTAARLTDWEQWPWDVFYFPLFFVWAWHCLRARSLWFFSASNPTLTFGGFEGEGKKEMYAQLPPGSFPTTVFVMPGEDFESVKAKIAAAGLAYPFAVKPDAGMKGLLFRKIENEAQLLDYHSRIPVEYLVQAWVDLPVELSVFYVRHPTEQRGAITGMTEKELLHVVGDGQSTVWELILENPRARDYRSEMRQKHEAVLSKILPKGEIFLLAIAANRNRGARLHNQKHLIDRELLGFFDHLSHHSSAFFYGRYDIKCASVEDLKRGKNYSILEFNGAGAAPNHIYHCGLTVWAAWAEIRRHWRLLADISAHNHQHGHRYWPFWEGLRYLRAARRHFALLKKIDSMI